ncbi:hypothetical protein E1301_Tti001879 [Triplophysa tibetana]|uniref:Uncharacterized protein n=1 Tax=Triplophysa tibetana TaxID=1572043 RepID=A0A5A9PIU7_9TELE|nr:hypothetical protein E1301_Tti001879 [Triplophysa tibetana]
MIGGGLPPECKTQRDRQSWTEETDGGKNSPHETFLKQIIFVFSQSFAYLRKYFMKSEEHFALLSANKAETYAIVYDGIVASATKTTSVAYNANFRINPVSEKVGGRMMTEQWADRFQSKIPSDELWVERTALLPLIELGAFVWHKKEHVSVYSMYALERFSAVMFAGCLT